MNTKIKMLILCLSMGLFLNRAAAQVKVGDNPTNINASAVFEMESTNKGLLLPRLTSAQRNAMSAPATGLVIYNTDKNCVEHYNGSAWYNVCDKTLTPIGGGSPTSGGSAVVSAWTSTVGCNVGAGANNSPAGVRKGAVNQTMVLGSPLTATVTLVANVTYAGTYNITTNTQNGITFSASGTFGAIGSQTITLTASGTPLIGGNFKWTTTTTPNIDIYGSVITAEAPLGGSYYDYFNGIENSLHNSAASEIQSNSYSTGEVFSNNSLCVEKPVSAQGCNGVNSVTVNSITYNTISINGQCWLQTNLAITPSVYSSYTTTSWTGGSTPGDQGYWGYYNTSGTGAWSATAPGTNEGILYQWCGAMDATISERSKGICPDNFHIPSDCEWMYLEHGQGMSIAQQLFITGYRPENVTNAGRPGDRLLSVITVGTQTNTSGFSAILTGYRSTIGTYTNRADNTNFWSSTSQSSAIAYSRSLLTPSKQGVLRQVYLKGNAFSVRCLKD